CLLRSRSFDLHRTRRHSVRRTASRSTFVRIRRPAFCPSRVEVSRHHGFSARTRPAVKQQGPVKFKKPATIMCSKIKDYHVTYFPTARHAVFVVSSLPEGENLALTRALAPGIFTHITKREQVLQALLF